MSKDPASITGLIDVNTNIDPVVCHGIVIGTAWCVAFCAVRPIADNKLVVNIQLGSIAMPQTETLITNFIKQDLTACPIAHTIGWGYTTSY